MLPVHHFTSLLFLKYRLRVIVMQASAIPSYCSAGYMLISMLKLIRLSFFFIITPVTYHHESVGFIFMLWLFVSLFLSIALIDWITLIRRAVNWFSCCI